MTWASFPKLVNNVNKPTFSILQGILSSVCTDSIKCRQYNHGHLCVIIMLELDIVDLIW